MLTNGDKLVVVKKVAPFLDEGDIVEVVNATDDGVISFAFGDGFMHMGVMNAAECESHFEKAEEESNEEVYEVTDEHIAEIMGNSEFEVFTSFDKCTIVSCKLPNGFVITEYVSFVNPDDYDEEMSADICFDKIAEKIWELETYRLQQNVFESENVCRCEGCDGCCCEEYDDEFDECLDTDLDCDDCEDFECPYNSNNRI